MDLGIGAKSVFLAALFFAGCSANNSVGDSLGGDAGGAEDGGTGGSSGSGSGSGSGSQSGSGGSTGGGGGGLQGGVDAGPGSEGGSGSSCDPRAWVYMGSDANACEGHVGESCGWTTTNEDQGYHCQTDSWGVDCEAGGTTCPGGSGSGSGGGSGSGSGGGSGSGSGTGSGSGSGGGPGGGPLPEHILTGYWQDFDNGAQVVTLAAVPASYNLVAVAFANADPSNPGGVTFSIDSGLASALGGYTEAQFQADIQTVHSQGRKVIVSVGGQNGTISVSDATSETNFATSVHSLMQKYGFDGVDIDLENGITPSAMAAALQQLSSLAGPGLVITLAPQTIDMQSTQGDYFALALSIKDILTIANMQYYNSGSMLGADGNVHSEGNVDFLTALAAIQLEGGLRPDQVGIGVPASTSAAGSGYVDPSVVNAALDCLAGSTNCGTFKPTTTYPTIRGAMTWSINWDGSNGYAFASAVSGHYASLP